MIPFVVLRMKHSPYFNLINVSLTLPSGFGLEIFLENTETNVKTFFQNLFLMQSKFQI